MLCAADGRQAQPALRSYCNGACRPVPFSTAPLHSTGPVASHSISPVAFLPLLAFHLPSTHDPTPSLLFLAHLYIPTADPAPDLSPLPSVGCGLSPNRALRLGCIPRSAPPAVVSAVSARRRAWSTAPTPVSARRTTLRSCRMARSSRRSSRWSARSSRSSSSRRTTAFLAFRRARSCSSLAFLACRRCLRVSLAPPPPALVG